MAMHPRMLHSVCLGLSERFGAGIVCPPIVESRCLLPPPTSAASPVSVPLFSVFPLGKMLLPEIVNMW
jgi:hypothetical protein